MHASLVNNVISVIPPFEDFTGILFAPRTLARQDARSLAAVGLIERLVVITSHGKYAVWCLATSLCGDWVSLMR